MRMMAEERRKNNIFLFVVAVKLVKISDLKDCMILFLMLYIIIIHVIIANNHEKKKI